MKKINLMFAALIFAALSLGFAACENPNDDSHFGENNESDTENILDNNGSDDDYACGPNDIVCTGMAYETKALFTKIAAVVHVPTTLLGQCTLGVQFSENLSDLEEHRNIRSYTTKNLTGNDFVVKLIDLKENTTYYYCAYVYINNVYHYGLIRSFKTLESDANSYVDLGLPSGLKWAAWNVGATSPEEYGDFYEYEEAQENFWGSPWRTPTKAEFEELLDECTWTWTTDYNGTCVKGRIVTGPNGNSIFLPAAGRRYGSDVGHVQYGGYYWSATENDSYGAYYLYFYSGEAYVSSYGRSYGQSVRLVQDL